ncbi:Lipopolysaccharide export system permease protein LptF [hydrothermal vent metagenome]|uniref:Lipopolysaccharide export system permease protein LptF n=1 Tax=hydrothermal vent metagenome TaxID=652676 RepID=A0A3B0YVU2_9ZZZZ
MALDRYINSEIAKPLVLGVTLLMVIFIGFTAAVKLGEAASGLIGLDTVARLIGLSTIIALEILLPTALYLSIIATLSRFYRDSEMSAMRASGIGELRILGSLSYITLIVAVIVGIISIYGRPWAYRESYRLEAEARAEFDIRKIEPGQFIALQDSKYILFARDVDKETGKLREVFLQSERGENVQVIFAREAYLPPVTFGEERRFELSDGYGYLLDVNGSRDRTLKYREMTIKIPTEKPDTNYRRKAEPTHVLRESKSPKDIAEFQWRSSTPLATLMLAMLAVPLSRSAPRQGRHNNFLIAILVYIGLFNLISVARNQVEEGTIPAFPGIWWVYILPALLFAALMLWPVWQRRRH